ncbi:hypothetical protein AB0E88_27745 [Streptomyces sp. NPDC028635]|uniref:ATP-dependent DNA ligase n=1 Tax=Streptomyces sp. NPDC028635 TaxID=3154800 RepID=UPI0033C3D123
MDGGGDVVRGVAATRGRRPPQRPPPCGRTARHLIVFDVLQLCGQELLPVPYAERRARLEQLFTEHDLHAPWTLCPETDDPGTAQEWLTSWTQVPGVEGLVIRGKPRSEPALGAPPGAGAVFQDHPRSGRGVRWGRLRTWPWATRLRCHGRVAP